MEDLAAAGGPDRLHYLYGFLRSAAALPPLDGIEPGGRVFTIGCGGVSCAVSLVPAAEYRQAGLARGEDWLAPRALRHHGILSALHEHATVLPLRFGALCDREADVRALVAERRDALVDGLRTFDGRDEWTLRTSLDEVAIDDRLERESPALSACRAREADLPEGRAYFARRQRARQAAALAADASAAVEDAILDRLALAGVPIVRGRRATARGVADAALLVARRRRPALKAALAALEAEHAWCGLRFALVGPWPPYSFAPAL